jgi:creatinine amidohydrolase
MRGATRVLADRTWTELDGSDEPILVVPLGSTEQHGPHLPLGTDTFIAAALCEALVEAREDLVAGPAIPVGASGEHQGFPGVISTGTETLAAVLVEVARSARAWTRGIVFVSGHGGNAAAIERALRVMEAEGDVSCVVTASSPGADAHAGRAETSLLLLLAPGLVRETVAVAGETRALSEIIGELRDAGVAAVSSNGVLGDPHGASAEEGRARLSAMTTAGLATIEARFGP